MVIVISPTNIFTSYLLGYLYLVFLHSVIVYLDIFLIHYPLFCSTTIVLRMELDIQRFLSNADYQHFEFQHFPSSYLRLAAHRVAQHYGMQTMVQDNGLDGQGTRIMVRKMAESRYPMVRLSEIPAKQLEDDKPEQIKIAIRPIQKQKSKPNSQS